MIFSKDVPGIGEFELMLFASPEARCLYGLDAVRGLGSPKRAWVFEFSDYEGAQPRDASISDVNAVSEYKNNRGEIDRWLDVTGAEKRRVLCSFGLLEPIDNCVGPPNPFNLPLVLDISCAPRGRLLALFDYLARCQAKTGQRVHLMYTLVQRHAVDEGAFSYGIQDIAVVPGFNGVIRLRRDLLIIVLGFEGNRAFSLYRRLMPNMTYLILGDSGDTDREFYLSQSETNNRSLLCIHGNEKLTMASRDPVLFAKQLDGFLKGRVEPVQGRYNVYFSCLGTKLQTLGAYLAIRAHRYIQVIDTIPSRRRIGSTGKGQTVFADLGSSGLLQRISDLAE